MRDMTKKFIIYGILIIAVYDIYVAIWGNNATISRILLEWSHQYIILPFAFGVVCGHLFWPQVWKGLVSIGKK